MAGDLEVPTRITSFLRMAAVGTTLINITSYYIWPLLISNTAICISPVTTSFLNPLDKF